MKITKCQLKKLIKEEINEISLKSLGAAANPLEPIYAALRALGNGLDDLGDRVNRLEDK